MFGTPQGNVLPFTGPATPINSTPQLSFGGTPAGNETSMKLEYTNRQTKITFIMGNQNDHLFHTGKQSLLFG